MAVEDIVTILADYCEDGEETFRELRGPEAVIAVRDAIGLIEGELSGQLEYNALWAEFEAAPRQTAPDLTGALEAIIEADPGLADKLEALLNEYYVASRPAVAERPAPGASEVVPREEVRIERHEAEPHRHTDDAGEGTYLYGNVPSGDVTVERALELGPDALAVQRGLETLSFDVRELFEQLQATVEQEPALSDQMRGELRAELEGLEAEVMLGEEADGERIVGHLRRIGQADPDVLELVLTGLRHTRSEAQALVQSAMERASR